MVAGAATTWAKRERAAQKTMSALALLFVATMITNAGKNAMVADAAART